MKIVYSVSVDNHDTTHVNALLETTGWVGYAQTEVVSVEGAIARTRDILRGEFSPRFLTVGEAIEVAAATEEMRIADGDLYPDDPWAAEYSAAAKEFRTRRLSGN